jgi:hypothetical protein
MSDESLTLGDLTTEILLDLLGTLGAELPLRCTVCNDTAWEYFPVIPAFFSKRRADYYHYTVASLTCRQCGQVLYFNLDKLGIASR